MLGEAPEIGEAMLAGYEPDETQAHLRPLYVDARAFETAVWRARHVDADCQAEWSDTDERLQGSDSGMASHSPHDETMACVIHDRGGEDVGSSVPPADRVGSGPEPEFRLLNFAGPVRMIEAQGRQVREDEIPGPNPDVVHRYPRQDRGRGQPPDPRARGRDSPTR